MPIGADTLHDTPRALAPASTRSSAACDRACSRRRRAGARESPCQQSCSLSSALADLAVASGAALKVCALREPGSPMHSGGALRAVIVARLNSSLLKFFSVAVELQLIVRGTDARKCPEAFVAGRRGGTRPFASPREQVEHGGPDGPGPDGRVHREGRARPAGGSALSDGGCRHVDVRSRKISRSTPLGFAVRRVLPR